MDLILTVAEVALGTAPLGELPRSLLIAGAISPFLLFSVACFRLAFKDLP